jgi:hypothetical protein
VCSLLRKEWWDEQRGRTAQGYSDDGEHWFERRPDCGEPLDKSKVPAPSEPRPEELPPPEGPHELPPIREPGKTVHGNQIYEVSIKRSDGRYFRAGIGFGNKDKDYIKVEMFAMPFGERWDGVLYLFPSKGKRDTDAGG